MEMPMCSHQWIDPEAPPIQRAPLSPVIGPRPREMKPDTFYRCNNCGAILKTPPKAADEKPLTLLGIPVRLDETLCEPNEVWLEQPNGEVVRVFPADPAGLEAPPR